MQRVMAGLIIVTLTMLGLSGCATPGQNKVVLGGAAGAAIGAGVGAGIGALVGGGKGAAYGAAAGALVGGIAGASLAKYFEDKKVASREEVMKEQNYDPNEGKKLVARKLEVMPTLANPGEEVTVKVVYDVLAPTEQQVPITQQWVFKHNNEELFSHNITAEQEEQGRHEKTFKFDMAKDSLPGEYEWEVTVSDGTNSTTLREPLVVKGA